MQQIRDFQVRGFMSSVSSAVATGTQIFRPPNSTSSILRLSN